MSTNKNSKSNKRPSHAIHQVIGNTENARWHRVGSAWMHNDKNGLNLKFDSFPLTGRIVLRAIEDKEVTGCDQEGAPSQ